MVNYSPILADGELSGESEREMSNSSLSSSPARSSISTAAVAGGAAPSSAVCDDFHFPADISSIQDQKDKALSVLKSDVMAALNKEVKAMDEDSWMFEGPRSSIHLITRPGGLLNQHTGPLKHQNLAPPK